MPLPYTSPPDSICILRLSAIGDISHMLPIIRTIQKAWPQTKLTWLIGKVEHQLVADIPGIEFIVFDKREGWRAYRKLRRAMKGRHFDALLHMQMSIRASLASLFIPADVKLGFDRKRARDGQWLFTNAQIEAREREHVIDSFFGFTDALGIRERVLQWDIPIPESARSFAEQQLPGDKPTLVISPCSSMAYRNWDVHGYAQVGDYAAEHFGMRVAICGGRSDIEREYANSITHLMHSPVIDLVGKTDLKQLLAVLEQATLLVAPDSGPAHLATAVGTPVIGLYAATNPGRAAPYRYLDLVVNRYPLALDKLLGKQPEEVPWGTRVRDPEAMLLITPADVVLELKQQLPQLLSER